MIESDRHALLTVRDRRLLDCGIVERGFARVVCPSCRYEILVPFSCKVRGLCPSCNGRRMAAGAADLVDHILPVVADYRQWTLSFPRWLRIRLLRDMALVSEVLLVSVRVVSAYHRRRARHRGIAGDRTGAVTAIQRVGSFANANLHFHTLIPEGVWHERPDGSLGFHPLPPPADEDVEEIAARIVGKIRRLTARPDGRVEYHFRRPDPSGRTSWVTDGATWCRRLATLIPPRRSHTTRFHGVVSSAHTWRARVVPSRPTAAEPATTITPPPTSMMLARRLDWAALLRRVFGEAVTTCPRCGDALRVLAFITDPRVTAHILDHLGLTSKVVPIAPARAPPDDPASELDFGA